MCRHGLAFLRNCGMGAEHSREVVGWTSALAGGLTPAGSDSALPVEPAERRRKKVWALALDPLEGGDELEAVAFVDPAAA